jgi:hypothetical protein
MGKDTGSISSFNCYNCNEKNFFNKAEYTGLTEEGTSSGKETSGSKVKEVSIECKNCREINTVKIEY